jgi:hypothetical protein
VALLLAKVGQVEDVAVGLDDQGAEPERSDAAAACDWLRLDLLAAIRSPFSPPSRWMH